MGILDPSSNTNTRSPVSLCARLVSAEFSPAAGYLLDGSPKLPRDVDLVRVDDADVGPILTHPGDTVVGHWIRVTKSWEPAEGRFLRSVLCPGMNVLDIGANIGYFTLMMARAVGPSGKVLAIEAEPDIFLILRANVELAGFDHVEMLPVAAHHTRGLLSIYRDPHNHGSSTAFALMPNWSATPVQAVRLDDVLDPDTPVDIIKVDVEGMDHCAVAGLERTIRTWGPTLLVELNPWKTESYGDRPEAVLQQYRDLGLNIRLLGGDAIRLQREGGMALDDLLLDDFAVTERIEAELIERARKIHFINLILTPRDDRMALRRQQSQIVR